MRLQYVGYYILHGCHGLGIGCGRLETERCEKIGTEDETGHFSVKESPSFREDGALDYLSKGQVRKDEKKEVVWQCGQSVQSYIHCWNNTDLNLSST
jgi:hypothetical protein